MSTKDGPPNGAETAIFTKVANKLEKCPTSYDGLAAYEPKSRTHRRRMIKRLKNVIKNGIFIQKEPSTNLCLDENYCHRNAREYVKKTKDTCTFYGFVKDAGNNPEDYEGDIWYEHSWVVDKNGQILETWMKNPIVYFGIPDYQNTPKNQHSICTKAAMLLRNEDKTKGCTINKQ